MPLPVGEEPCCSSLESKAVQTHDLQCHLTAVAKLDAVVKNSNKIVAEVDPGNLKKIEDVFLWVYKLSECHRNYTQALWFLVDFENNHTRSSLNSLPKMAKPAIRQQISENNRTLIPWIDDFDKIKEYRNSCSLLIHTLLEISAHLDEFNIIPFQDSKASPLSRKEITLNRISLKKTYSDVSDTSFLFLGLLLGSIVTIFTSTLYKLCSNAEITENRNLVYALVLQSHLAFSLPLIICILISLNMMIWHKLDINYAFILKVEAGRNMKPVHFLAISLSHFLLWLLFLRVIVDDSLDSTIRLLLPFTHVFVACLPYAAFFALPIPGFPRSSRKWVICKVCRVYTSLFKDLDFGMFFVADILGSVVFVFPNVPVSVGMFVLGLKSLLSKEKDAAVDGGPELKASVLALPSSLWCLGFLVVPYCTRFVQCARAAFKARALHPNATNALKYIFGITMAVLLFVWRNYSRGWLALLSWVLFSLIFNSYAFVWDTAMDWWVWDAAVIFGTRGSTPKAKKIRSNISTTAAGLKITAHHPRAPEQQQEKNPKKRRFAFTTMRPYRIGVAVNAFLRLVWIFLLMPGTLINDYHFFWIAWVSGIFEVLRRAQWCFFRMENEVLNNCGNFRPVLPVPPLCNYLNITAKNSGALALFSDDVRDEIQPESTPSSILRASSQEPAGHENTHLQVDTTNSSFENSRSDRSLKFEMGHPESPYLVPESQ